MNNNLPQIKKEGMFVKIKNWFRKIFTSKDIIEQQTQKTMEEINNNVATINKDSFKDSIKVENKDRVLFLQRQLKEKQIQISDLTDEELDEIIELYEKQVEEKEKVLKQYKDKLNSTKEE